MKSSLDDPETAGRDSGDDSNSGNDSHSGSDSDCGSDSGGAATPQSIAEELMKQVAALVSWDKIGPVEHESFRVAILLKPDVYLRVKKLVKLGDAAGLRKVIRDCMAPTPKPRKRTQVAHGLRFPLSHLRDAWTQSYIGDALWTFQRLLNHLSSTFTPETHYSKVLAIVQSSGVGKSRLIDEFSKLNVGVIYTLRSGEDAGYPPGDTEITDFLHRARNGDLHHAGVVSLMASSIREISKEFQTFKGSSNQFAAYLHMKMSPPTNVSALEITREGKANQIATTRSRFRKDFCARVIQGAKNTLEKLRSDMEWRALFRYNKDKGTDLQLPFPALGRNRLLISEFVNPASDLIEQISQRSVASAVNKCQHAVHLFFSIDEVSNLVFEHDNMLFLALRRVMRIIENLPVWLFVLSTQSPLQHLSPPAALDNSSRISSGTLERMRPFYAFPLDVEAARILKEDFEGQIYKPLDSHASSEHLTMFGRPLWSGYRNYECHDLREFALKKLLGNPIFNPENENHVLAALSSRICLEPCINGREAVLLQETAVCSHLRIILEMDANNGLVRTTMQPEPVVVEALAHHFATVPRSWAKSIDCLVHKLLRPGLIDKGRTGELVIRLLIVMARDQHSSYILKHSKSSGQFNQANPFKAMGFLGSLFAKAVLNQIADSPAALGGRVRDRPPAKTVGALFEGAWANFTYFSATESFLDADNLKELVHNLMFCGAALQLCPTQPLWDLMIPIYFGSPAKEFNPEMLSVILIQVKNRKARSNLFVTAKDYDIYFTETWKTPILVLLLDTGIEHVSVTQKRTHRDDLVAFEISGMAREVYQCLANEGAENHMLVSAIQLLMDTITAPSGDIQNSISMSNLRFDKFTWNDRFGLESRAGAKEADLDDGVVEAGSESGSGSENRNLVSPTAGQKKKHKRKNTGKDTQDKTKKKHKKKFSWNDRLGLESRAEAKEADLDDGVVEAGSGSGSGSENQNPVSPTASQKKKHKRKKIDKDTQDKTKKKHKKHNKKKAGKSMRVSKKGDD